MTTIYVMRHGQADPGDGGSAGDAQRPLTAAGVNALEQAARAMHRVGIVFDCIISSPLLRTMQTAQCVGAIVAAHAPIVQDDSLAPGRGASTVLRSVPQGAQAVLIVGHLPDLSQLTNALLRQPAGEISYRPGGLARIDFAGAMRPRTGALRWVRSLEEMAAAISAD